MKFLTRIEPLLQDDDWHSIRVTAYVGDMKYAQFEMVRTEILESEHLPAILRSMRQQIRNMVEAEKYARGYK